MKRHVNFTEPSSSFPVLAFMKPATILALTLTLGAVAPAQMQDNQKKDLRCEDQKSRRNHERFCEVREVSAPFGGSLAVDAGQNGGVAVKGWLRNEVLVRAKINAEALTESEARSLASQVQLTVNSGRVSASGPSNGKDQNWSVSFEVFVPQRTDLNLSAHNGGVHVQDVFGDIQMQTQNGGVHLARLGGRVRGTTINGGVHVELTGNRWDGTELDLKTTNGGVHIEMPENYSARVEASTINGRVHSDIPNANNDKENRTYAANIGGGGAMIRAVTNNGGVHIGRK